MKSIQDKSDLLLKQIMFSKYFLLCLGIKNVNDDFDIKPQAHRLRIKKDKDIYRDFMSDVLYVKLDKLTLGLGVNEKGGINLNGRNVANGIVSVIMKLIDTKMIINDDLVILSWIFCNANGKSKIFLNHLLGCVTDCLNGKSEYKVRNYFYFKQFLLHSNIWCCKDGANDKLLFDYINTLADKLLIDQKRYIRDSIGKEEKEDNEMWNKLCDFSKYNSRTQFRQDKIVNGIESIKSIKDAYVTASKISNPDYNVLSEFNDKIYLIQCLTFANENNMYFQSEIKKIFSKTADEYLFGLTKNSIKEAPVKAYDRCIAKSSFVFFSFFFFFFMDIILI